VSQITNHLEPKLIIKSVHQIDCPNCLGKVNFDLAPAFGNIVKCDSCKKKFYYPFRSEVAFYKTKEWWLFGLALGLMTSAAWELVLKGYIVQFFLKQ